jgi:hypothetical protein
MNKSKKILWIVLMLNIPAFAQVGIGTFTPTNQLFWIWKV